jgi:hypothetical protein
MVTVKHYFATFTQPEIARPKRACGMIVLSATCVHLLRGKIWILFLHSLLQHHILAAPNFIYCRGMQSWVSQPALRVKLRPSCKRGGDCNCSAPQTYISSHPASLSEHLVLLLRYCGSNNWLAVTVDCCSIYALDLLLCSWFSVNQPEMNLQNVRHVSHHKIAAQIP